MKNFNNKSDFNNDNADWHLPIPKHHMYAICILMTIGLFTAVLLPTPNEMSEASEHTWTTTGRLPDSHQDVQSIIYVDDKYATESFDSEPIDDADLFDKEELLENITAEKESNDIEWYEQTVEPGDNINNIFQTINQPYELIKAISSVNKYGPEISKIKPGDKLYFQLTPNNELLSFVKPYNKEWQIRYFRTQPSINKFEAVKEHIDSHLIEVAANETTSSDIVTVEQAQNIKENTEITKKTTNETAINTKTEEDKKIAELKKQAEELEKKNKPIIAVKKELLNITIVKGDSFISACTNAGLSKSEAYSILSMYKGRLQGKNIMPGDTIKILFDSNKPNSKIVAVSINSKKMGVLNTFKNPKNGKFYDETGVNITKNEKFNRFPIKGNVRITSNFNPYRKHPITHKVRPHNGTDFGVKIGTPIYAPASGVVTKATYQKAAGYYIVIQHKGAYSTVYMHLSKILVKPGAKIKAGQMIAKSGNTGASTGPHLHYELRINGRPVNAMKVNLPNMPIQTQSVDPEMSKIINTYKNKMKLANNKK
ncbi:MAG: peptidoglycan DD-metalloendopeptidase family protein [Succinivibrionaceae bacterium]